MAHRAKSLPQGRNELFRVPTQVASNLKGRYTEEIARAYLKYKIVPILRECYAYVGFYSPNRGVLFGIWDWLTRITQSSKLVPPHIYALNISRVELGESMEEIGIVTVGELGRAHSIKFNKVDKDTINQALHEVEEFIANVKYITPKTNETIIKVNELLRKTGYRPDFIVIAADEIETKILKINSQLPIKETFEIPVIDLKKVIFVEVKSSKSRKRVTFTKKQLKFIEHVKSLPIGEFLLLYFPLDDVLPLKDIPVIVYSLSQNQEKFTNWEI